jgi:hypothetical protein
MIALDLPLEFVARDVVNTQRSFELSRRHAGIASSLNPTINGHTAAHWSATISSSCWRNLACQLPDAINGASLNALGVVEKLFIVGLPCIARQRRRSIGPVLTLVDPGVSRKS